MQVKSCTRCEAAKPFADFSVDRRKKSGLCSWCKQCQREYQVANSDRRREWAAEWREKNREKLRAAEAEWRSSNPEAVREKQRRFRLENPERARSHVRAYYLRNKERESARKKRYREQNRDLVQARLTARKASKLRATPAWANKSDIAQLYEIAAVLSRGGVKFHVDHEVPLISRLVCGLHTEANLRVVPWHENVSKQNRYWPDMP